MKTIEEKAKAYDEVLGRAKSLVDFCSDNELKTLNFVFSELKENEDDRIREGIILNLEYSINKSEGFVKDELKERIAWLEKQGKPVEINPSEFDSRLNKLLKQFETLPKEELASSLSFYLNVVQNNGTYKEKKQCEKPQGKSAVDAINEEKVDNQNCVKPSIKVEPKFKVGDWCIDNEDGIVFQIVKVLDNTYRYRTNEGKEYSCTHYSLELDARFWTISDAKDGDVLYTPKGAGAEGIFLIKGWEQVECIGKTLCSRIGYRVKDDEVVAGGLGAIWWEGVIDPFYPATKEQRDLLFQKMKEAGYKKDLSNFG